MVRLLDHPKIYADEMTQDVGWSLQKDQPCDTSPTSWEGTGARDSVKSHA